MGIQPTAGAPFLGRVIHKLANNLHKINTDDDRKVKPHRGYPASSSAQDIYDFLFYPGWSGTGGVGPADPLEPVREQIAAALYGGPPPKYDPTWNTPIRKLDLAPKPGDRTYVSPKLLARLDAELRVRQTHDPSGMPGPGGSAPGQLPEPGEASLNPAAVTHRMLSTQQARARNYQAVSWTQIAKRYGIPAPELIAAAMATYTPANPVAADKLAAQIRRGIGRAGGSLQVWLSNTHPHADPVDPIYKAADAEGFHAVYPYDIYSP